MTIKSLNQQGSCRQKAVNTPEHFLRGTLNWWCNWLLLLIRAAIDVIPGPSFGHCIILSHWFPSLFWANKLQCNQKFDLYNPITVYYKFSPHSHYYLGDFYGVVINELLCPKMLNHSSCWKLAVWILLNIWKAILILKDINNWPLREILRVGIGKARIKVLGAILIILQKAKSNPNRFLPPYKVLDTYSTIVVATECLNLVQTPKPLLKGSC